MEYQKLYRSRTNKVFAGVAGGLGDFFAIDPVIIRIIFTVLALMGGGGVLIYILLWIFVPYKEEFSYNSSSQQNTQSSSQAPEPDMKDNDFNKPQDNNEYNKVSRRSLFGGIILITLGILFLIDRLIPQINFGELWPVILIVIGILILAGSVKKKNN